MTVGLIFTAGSETRFNCDTPKALMPISNCTLLDVNIENMKAVCDEVYIVCSTSNEKFFTSYNRIVIPRSGFGCGDAVLQALSDSSIPEDADIFIQWGDSLQSPQLYQHCVSEKQKDTIIVPCVLQSSPYVQIVVDFETDRILKVLFSKYKEETSFGYHDLSLFYGNCELIKNSLVDFASRIWSIDKYKHLHGNELNFLDIFNETGVCGKVITAPDCYSFCFNTVDEYRQMIKNYTEIYS